MIVISSVIGRIIEQRCGRASHLIYNGVLPPKPVADTDYLASLGVVPGKYILAVARFVPEKGLSDLIEAFSGLLSDYKLVIAGDADHETEYSRNLKKSAAAHDGIILTGYLTGLRLDQVFRHAGLFVLPSYHEGLPIALLEALSYGLPVLVSNIPANREVDLASDRFFRTGDIIDLRDKLRNHLDKEMCKTERDGMLTMIAEKYNWERIADQTIEVYRAAAGKKCDDCVPVSG